MNDKPVIRIISGRQYMMLACSVLMISTMLSLPMSITTVSAQDAVFTFSIPVLYCFAVAFLLYKLARYVPGKNMFEIAEHICGRWIGSALNLLLIFSLFYELIVSIRLYADYFNSSILLLTPEEIIVLVTISLLIFFGFGSLESLARMNELFFPIFFAILLLLPVMLLNEMDMKHLFPALSAGWLPPLQGGLLGIGGFNDVIALGAFLGNIRNPRHMYVSLKMGIVLSAFVLTVWIFLVITVIGPTASSRMIYVGWILVQQIHITDFLDRVDLIVMSLWLPLLFIKFVVLFLAILNGFATLTGSQDYRSFNIMTALLIVIVTMISFTNVMDVIDFSNYGLLPISEPVQLLFFAMTFAFWWRRRKEAAVEPETSRKDGYPVWIALVCCLVVIPVGAYFGKSQGLYGNVSIIVFAVLVLAILLLSFREYRNEMRNVAE